MKKLSYKIKINEMKQAGFNGHIFFGNRNEGSYYALFPTLSANYKNKEIDITYRINKVENDSPVIIIETVRTSIGLNDNVNEKMKSIYRQIESAIDTDRRIPEFRTYGTRSSK
jgi:hypothetical protein